MRTSAMPNAQPNLCHSAGKGPVKPMPWGRIPPLVSARLQQGCGAVVGAIVNNLVCTIALVGCTASCRRASDSPWHPRGEFAYFRLHGAQAQCFCCQVHPCSAVRQALLVAQPPVAAPTIPGGQRCCAPCHFSRKQQWLSQVAVS